MSKKTIPLILPKQCSWLFAFCRKKNITDANIKNEETGVFILGAISKGLKDFEQALDQASQQQELGYVTSLFTSPLKEWKAYLKHFFHYAPDIQSLDELIIFKEIQLHNIREMLSEERKICTHTKKYIMNTKKGPVTKTITSEGFNYGSSGCEADLEKKILHFYAPPKIHENTRDIVASALFATETFGQEGNNYHPSIREIPQDHVPLYHLFFEGVDSEELIDLEEV